MATSKKPTVKKKATAVKIKKIKTKKYAIEYFWPEQVRNGKVRTKTLRHQVAKSLKEAKAKFQNSFTDAILISVKIDDGIRKYGRKTIHTLTKKETSATEAQLALMKAAKEIAGIAGAATPEQDIIELEPTELDTLAEVLFFPQERAVAAVEEPVEKDNPAEALLDATGNKPPVAPFELLDFTAPRDKRSDKAAAVVDSLIDASEEDTDPYAEEPKPKKESDAVEAVNSLIDDIEDEAHTDKSEEWECLACGGKMEGLECPSCAGKTDEEILNLMGRTLWSESEDTPDVSTPTDNCPYAAPSHGMSGAQFTAMVVGASILLGALIYYFLK